jgi:hypothetical protein
MKKLYFYNKKIFKHDFLKNNYNEKSMEFNNSLVKIYTHQEYESKYQTSNKFKKLRALRKTPIYYQKVR